MTISLKGNAQGGVVEANGAPAANVSSASGLPFMKNKLINGEVTRINQRNVANWAAVANGDYGYDRWKKIDASNMTQIIEAGNFRPNTVHTLSGIGVTTQQITSPASGNWQIPNIPIAATNVQVEEGLEATPFEVRHIGFELSLCQRYYERFVTGLAGYVNAASGQIAPIATFKIEKRAVPTLTLVSNSVLVNASSVVFDNVTALGARLVVTATAAGTASVMSLYSANAEIP